MASCPNFPFVDMSTSLRPPPSGAKTGFSAFLVLVLSLCLSLWLLASPASAQTLSDAPSRAASATSPTATFRVASKPAVSGPLWSQLSAAQRQALQPLAAHWNGLPAAHKSKWLAVSRNYAKLSPAEQATLQTRMTDWAGLSPRQRTLARLNFAEVKRIPADERQSKWEAYQALSADEKHQLAERANALPRGATTLVRPVPARKLAPTPSVKGKGHSRIQLTRPKPIPKLPGAATAPAAAGVSLVPAQAAATGVAAPPVLPQAARAPAQVTPARNGPVNVSPALAPPGVRQSDLPALGN